MSISGRVPHLFVDPRRDPPVSCPGVHGPMSADVLRAHGVGSIPLSDPGSGLAPSGSKDVDPDLAADDLDMALHFARHGEAVFGCERPDLGGGIVPDECIARRRCVHRFYAAGRLTEALRDVRIDAAVAAEREDDLHPGVFCKKSAADFVRLAAAGESPAFDLI